MRSASCGPGGAGVVGGAATVVVVAAAVVAADEAAAVGATRWTPVGRPAVVGAGSVGAVVAPSPAPGRVSVAASPPALCSRGLASSSPAMSAVTSSSENPGERLRLGRDASQGEWRTGSSTRRYETAARTTEPATTTSRWTTDSGPHVTPTSTSAGQCHR